MKQILIRFAREDRGATMIEYAIMLALVAAIAIAVVMILGQETRDGYQRALDCIRDPGACDR